MDCSVTVLHCVVYMEEEKRMKLIAPIAKSQHMREIWFHVMSGGVMLKIVVMYIVMGFFVLYSRKIRRCVW